MTPKFKKDWQNSYVHGMIVVLVGPSPTKTIDELRELYDPKISELEGAHITISEPFKEQPTSEDIRNIMSILGIIEPFVLNLGTVDTFPETNTVKINVKPTGKLADIRSRLHATGMFHKEVEHPGGFTPHITITENKNEQYPADKIIQHASKEISRHKSVEDWSIVYCKPDDNFMIRTIAQLYENTQS